MYSILSNDSSSIKHQQSEHPKPENSQVSGSDSQKVFIFITACTEIVNKIQVPCKS